jgi:hypothetical protein
MESSLKNRDLGSGIRDQEPCIEFLANPIGSELQFNDLNFSWLVEG